MTKPNVQLASSILYAVADAKLMEAVNKELEVNDPKTEEMERAIANNDQGTKTL